MSATTSANALLPGRQDRQGAVEVSVWQEHARARRSGATAKSTCRSWIRKFHILKPTAKGCKELHSQCSSKARASEPVEINGSPAIANGRVYFMTSDDVLLHRQEGPHDEAPTAIPPGPQADRLAKDAKPALLASRARRRGADAGDSVKLQGTRLSTTTAERSARSRPNGSWRGPLPPQSADRLAEPPAAGAAAPRRRPPSRASSSATTARHQADRRQAYRRLQFGRVVAKAGGLTGVCPHPRRRPSCPFAADFTKVPDGPHAGRLGQLPGQVRRRQSRRTAPSPEEAATNSQSARGSRQRLHRLAEHDRITPFEADVQGTKVRNDMPDMGVDANRYTLHVDRQHAEAAADLVGCPAAHRQDHRLPLEARRLVSHEADRRGARATRPSCAARFGRASRRSRRSGRVEVEDPTPNTRRRPGPVSATPPASGTGKVPARKSITTNVKITPNK